MPQTVSPPTLSALAGSEFQAGPSAIDSVRQGTDDGKTVCEAFYRSDGEARVVRAAKDGSWLR